MTKKISLEKAKRRADERYSRLLRRTLALIKAAQRFQAHANWRRTGEGTGDPDSEAALERKKRLAKRETEL